MGKFQLNKKGDDPIKIYEDTFKIAQGTVETHLGKLGKMPNPISSERLARDGEQTYTGYWGHPKDTVPQTGNCPNCGHTVSAHSGANTGDNLCYGGGNCDCHITFPWIKESKAREWKSVEVIAKEAISEDEKDDIFQYLFDLQDSGITNMFGAGPYVEREFPHLDKKEVRDVVLEWMKNYEEIHARMGIESKATEIQPEDLGTWWDSRVSGINKKTGGFSDKLNASILGGATDDDINQNWSTNWDDTDTSMKRKLLNQISDQPTTAYGGIESKAKEYDDEYEYDDDGTKLNPLYDDDDEYIDGSDVPTSGTYESKAKEWGVNTNDLWGDNDSEDQAAMADGLADSYSGFSAVCKICGQDESDHRSEHPSSYGDMSHAGNPDMADGSNFGQITDHVFVFDQEKSGY